MARADGLEKEPSASNSLGITARVDTAGARFYTAAEAARLLGKDISTIYRRYRSQPAGDDDAHMLVPAGVVDGERAAQLRRLGVADAAPSDASPGVDAPDRPAPPPAEAMALALVRDLLAGDALADEALRKMEEANELMRRRAAALREAVSLLLPLSRND